MPGYSKRDVILIQYPFSDRSNAKVRPAIIIGAPHTSQDIFVVPLTSKTDTLLAGEFVLDDWKGAGLNIASAVKRGIYTVHQSLIRKRVGAITCRMPNVLTTLFAVG
jgi:PemK-like, MazF-like toxin of type II toxin-antitoxin system